jgi:pSer/pThr/pTyr-binding forkhead associated (FHA) protein
MDPVVVIVLLILAAIALMLFRRKKTAQHSPGPVELPKPEHPNVRQRTQYEDEPDVTPTNSAITLTAKSGPLQGKQFTVPPGLFRIGAAADNDLIITGDDYVSSNHAHVEPAAGGFRLLDDKSRNGTWLNGQRLGVEPAVLKTGDIIKIGHSEFQVAGAATPKGSQ